MVVGLREEASILPSPNAGYSNLNYSSISVMSLYFRVFGRRPMRKETGDVSGSGGMMDGCACGEDSVLSKMAVSLYQIVRCCPEYQL